MIRLHSGIGSPARIRLRARIDALTMIKIAADCEGGCFSFHLEDKYRDRYTMIMHALINEASYMALGHKVDLERVRTHQLKQLEAETEGSVQIETCCPRSKGS